METQEKFTKLLNTDIIAVEVHKTAESIIKKESKICFYEHAGAYPNEKEIDLGFDFELLGEATEDEISFDVEPHVDGFEFFDNGKHTMFFKDYNQFKKLLHDIFCFKTTKESFRSLLQASGLNWENPFSNKCKKETPPSKDLEHLKQWQEAESKLIKGKLIFLKIVK